MQKRDDGEAARLRRLYNEGHSDELCYLVDQYSTNSDSEYEPCELSSYSENEMPMKPNHSNAQNKNSDEILFEVSSLKIKDNVPLDINIFQYYNH